MLPLAVVNACVGCAAKSCSLVVSPFNNIILIRDYLTVILNSVLVVGLEDSILTAMGGAAFLMQVWPAVDNQQVVLPQGQAGIGWVAKIFHPNSLMISVCGGFSLPPVVAWSSFPSTCPKLQLQHNRSVL